MECINCVAELDPDYFELDEDGDPICEYCYGNYQDSKYFDID